MWQSSLDLAQRLYRNYDRYDFFQLSRWLLLYGPRPDNTGIVDAVKFRGSLSLAFPDAEVESLKYEPGSDTIRVTTPVFGLTGPAGVLPYHDLEELSYTQSDENLSEFFDLFQHRLIGLLYEVWRKNRPDIDLQHHSVKRRRTATGVATPLQSLQSATGPATTDDQFTQVQLSIAGFFSSSANRLAQVSVFDPTVYATLNAYFAQPVRSGTAVVGVLQACLGVAVVLKPLIPRRLLQPIPDRSIIGYANGTGRYNRLGRDAILGPYVWDHQSQYELVVGPLDAAQFDRFNPWLKPGTDASEQRLLTAFQQLRQLVTATVGDSLDCLIRLNLKPGVARPVPLGQVTLGYNSWLGQVPQQEFCSDPHFPVNGTYA